MGTENMACMKNGVFKTRFEIYHGSFLRSWYLGFRVMESTLGLCIQATFMNPFHIPYGPIQMSTDPECCRNPCQHMKP